MSIDLYSPRTLAAVIERMPKVTTFLRDTFFTDIQTFDSEIVEFDMVKGGRELAPFVHPKLSAPARVNTGYATKSYKAPLVTESNITTAEDLLKRQPGEHIYSGKSPAERAVQKVMKDLMKQDEAITRREEWMAAQAIFTGTCPVVGEGLDEVIDFNFTQKVELTQDKWSDAGTDILGQLEDWARTVRQNGYTKCNIAVMDHTAANALVNSAQMKELLDVKNYELAKIAPKQLPSGAIWIGRYGKLGLDFYQYDEWYVDDWTDKENPETKQLVPEGTIALMSTEAQFSRLYGAVNYIPYGETDFVTAEAARVASAWVEHNPDRKFLGTKSRPLLVPHEVDSWLVAKVL